MEIVREAAKQHRRKLVCLGGRKGREGDKAEQKERQERKRRRDERRNRRIIQGVAKKLLRVFLAAVEEL